MAFYYMTMMLRTRRYNWILYISTLYFVFSNCARDIEEVGDLNRLLKEKFYSSNL